MNGMHSARIERVFGLLLYNTQVSDGEGGGRTQGSMTGFSYSISPQRSQSSCVPQADPTPTEVHMCTPEGKADVCQEPAHQVTQHRGAFFPLPSHHWPKTERDSKCFALATDHRASNQLCIPAWSLTLAWRCGSPVGFLLVSV